MAGEVLYKVLYAVICLALTVLNIRAGIKTCDYDKEKETISFKQVCYFISAFIWAVAFVITLGRI